MVVPRSVTVLFCTVLQLCFGTVYAWSFFQVLLVRQLGWTFTENGPGLQHYNILTGLFGGLGRCRPASARSPQIGDRGQLDVCGRLCCWGLCTQH